MQTRPVCGAQQLRWRERLPHLPTAAHATPSLVLQQAALGLAALPVYAALQAATIPQSAGSADSSLYTREPLHGAYRG